MISRTVKHPYLEMHFSTEYNSIIREVYQKIKPFPICWLAFENLEIQYPDYHINRDVKFTMYGGTIVFKHKKNHGQLATVYFDQALVNTMNKERASFSMDYNTHSTVNYLKTKSADRLQSLRHYIR